MAKILEATCSAGVVKVGSLVIDPVTILSLGDAPESTGTLLIDEDKAYYIASNATDIQSLIESMVAILDKIILIATGLDAVTVSPGGQAANILQLTLLKTQLDLTKDVLK